LRSKGTRARPLSDDDAIETAAIWLSLGKVFRDELTCLTVRFQFLDRRQRLAWFAGYSRMEISEGKYQ